MIPKYLQRALEPQLSLKRIIEDQERWHRLMERPGIFDVMERTSLIERRLQSITNSATAYQQFVDSHVRRTNEISEMIDRIAKPSWLAALDKVNLPPSSNTIFAKLSYDLARHQSRLDAIGVKFAIHPSLDGVLKDLSENQIAARLSLIASASSQFDTIGNQASFAKVGAAVSAAARALSDESIHRRDFSGEIDGFFGDWARIAQLPKGYGRNESARRETLQEVKADDALLDVSTEEAAALFSQSSFSPNGTPIVLLGEPIGLVVAQDPDDIAARLLRRVERTLRALIDGIFRKNYGDNWPADLMPERAGSWSEKRNVDEQNNLPVHELIHYAEFSELPDILNKHWSQNFAGRGSTAKKVTSRIRALIPHRNYEFHSRPVTPEQLLSIVYSVRMLESFLSHEKTEDYDT